MSKKLKHPIFFPGILKAISQLQNSKGTTEAKILDYIQRLMLVINPASSNAQKLRNVPQQVRRALKHATRLGLVTQKGVKYMLTIDHSNKISKPRTQMPKLRIASAAVKGRTVRASGGAQPDKACPHCKKGKRRRARARRNRNRRRRRRAHTCDTCNHLDDDSQGVDSKESLSTDLSTV